MRSIMIYFFIVLAILIGCLMPIQASLNAELTRQLNHPFLGAFLSLSLGALVVSFLILFYGKFEEIKRVLQIPPHLYIGGILSAVFVGSSLYLIPKMGATALISSFIIGQLIASLILDHFGLFGLPHYQINFTRLVGVFLLFAGLFLVIRREL